MLTCGNLQEMRFFFRFYCIFGHGVVWHVFLPKRLLPSQLRFATGAQPDAVPVHQLVPFVVQYPVAVSLPHGDSLRVFLSPFCSWLPRGDSCLFSTVLRFSQLSLRHVSKSLSITLSLSRSLSLTPDDLDLHLDLDHSSFGLCCKLLFLRLVLSHLLTFSHSVCLPFPVSVLVVSLLPVSTHPRPRLRQLRAFRASVVVTIVGQTCISLT